MLTILFLLLHVLFALLFFFLTVAFVTGAPFVPTKNKASHIMIDFAHIQKGDIVYDLGSGDGRLLLLAAARGAKATGYEINPFLVLLTNIRFLFSPYRKNLHVYWKNFWSAGISDADAVFVYLLPWKMDTLSDKLKKNLKSGTIIVSNSFIFPGWKIIHKNEEQHIYAFRI